MISELLLPDSECGARPLLVHDREQVVTWNAVHQEVERLLGAYAPYAGQPIGLCFPASCWGLASLAAFDRLGCDTVLIDHRFSTDHVQEVISSLGLTVALRPALSEGQETWECLFPAAGGAARASGQRTVTILTSGTTGTPKAVCHTWESLLRPVRLTATKKSATRWLLSYRPHLYAGLQVLLQALAAKDTLAVPRLNASPTEIAELLRQARVEFASATPSYWRQLCLFSDREELSRVPLRQITLGGEVVDQLLLDQLHALFPTAQISHIYATTELGRCFSVRDGRAGFPVGLLDATTTDGVQLKIVDGELYVKSANAMLGYQTSLTGNRDQWISPGKATADWFATGDMVEISADRVYFVGRRSDLINVGGNKVAPAHVERVVRNVPGVVDVRVFGKASSLAGQIVACQIVASPSVDTTLLRQQVTIHCRAHLPLPQVPRWLEFVPQIELTESGKTARSV